MFTVLQCQNILSVGYLIRIKNFGGFEMMWFHGVSWLLWTSSATNRNFPIFCKLAKITTFGSITSDLHTFTVLILQLSLHLRPLALGCTLVNIPTKVVYTFTAPKLKQVWTLQMQLRLIAITRNVLSLPEINIFVTMVQNNLLINSAPNRL